ncbi:GNAT family N-acetyltransferase [Pandoraea sputorum]|uniref:GNAT family N-acetyltransferase n=1 Tax=Pandoraea sputorum TaxID=93222 RepID=A0A5E5BG57_9BURK|nr:GNAT family N-acetyltransferase [Pandoraea sputorum]VVE84308.1 GNAT family N-acetyltransferase [Pandoraea sputorum]
MSNDAAPLALPASLVIERLDGDQALAAIDALTDVLIDCVEGGASVSFLLPLTRERATTFWRKVAASVDRGERVLLVARHKVHGAPDAPGAQNDGAIVGTVQLILDLPENQPHRADVAKMLVHRSARRQGVAAHLMAALDDVARAFKRHVLVLDTVTGGDAERLYQRSGWQRAGDVPKFALMPDGRFCATTFYYKHL